MRISRNDRKLARISGWGTVVALGLLQAWTYRNRMNPDGISYLEIGRAGISGWHGFVLLEPTVSISSKPGASLVRTFPVLGIPRDPLSESGDLSRGICVFRIPGPGIPGKSSNVAIQR
jgi:hypothetical protein